MALDLAEEFGQMDIYLFDQLLKGRIDPSKCILDAGCGRGRNLVYFLKNGFEMHAIDQNPQWVEMVRGFAGRLVPQFPLDHIRTGLIEDLPYGDGAFDVVISNAVLHFSRDKSHFESMLFSMWRVLKEGGLLFVRLASRIGIENVVTDDR